MLSELPQWQVFRTAWRRLMFPSPVSVIISDRAMFCCWRRAGHSWFRSVLWPEGACRDGFPQQSDAISECLADLLLDLDLPGAELILTLPPAAASWCVLDGLSADPRAGMDVIREALGTSDVPFNLDQSYLATTYLQDSVAVAGLPRLSLRAWVDVVESADLSLRRIGWSILDAQRTLIRKTQDWAGDLAWLVCERGMSRLILMRDQVPEVDHRLTSTEPVDCCVEARACLQAWQMSLGEPRPLGWWLTLEDTSLSDWSCLVDAELGERLLNQALACSPEPWSDSEELDALPPLAHLALMSLYEEASW